MFIQTEAGAYINATEIVGLTQAKEGGIWQWYATHRNGCRYRIYESQVHRLAREGSLLPSRPGDVAVVVTVMDESPGGYEVDRVPIVGWVVDGDEDSPYATPVIAACLADNQFAGVLRQDGKVHVEHDRLYDTLAAFAQHQREFYREREERKKLKAV